MKASQKRNIRNYRVADGPYKMAKEKAAKTNKSLSSRIEEFVYSYAGVERTPYCAAMGNMLIKGSNKKKK